jgi:hypothetical protein
MPPLAGRLALPLLALAFSSAPALAAAHRVRVAERDLFPRDAHARTRAAHRRMVASWSAPAPAAPGSPVIFPTAFGADPTGAADSTAAFAAAVAAAVARNASGQKMSDGIADLGGVVIDLQGGEYLLSAPLAIPQFVGNLRIIDGTLRASPSFPADRFVVEVGATPCSTPSGQGSCNENVGMSGLTVDGSHVAAGCVRISATMGATLDASSAVFGFVSTGILLAGGHEAMVMETWVAAYFWSDPKKERNDAVGIKIAGNDHFITNVIVFSSRVGVEVTGAANLLTNVHTWNSATGNGGIGILNTESQNRFVGCYLDFTDLVNVGSGAQQLSVADGFFLGDAQLVFEASAPGQAVYGVSLSGNVWYDCSAPALAVNETAGTFTSVTDFSLVGTAFCGSGQAKTGFTRATRTLAKSHAPDTFDFSSVLLFPSAPIVSASVVPIGGSGALNAYAWIGSISAAQVVVYSNNDGLALEVTVDQSSYSTTSKQG